jgi:hypothetical protein
MAQITWRNVGGSSGGSSGASANTQAQASATDTLMKAFDPLRNELNARQGVNTQNWDNTAKQNTQAMRAQLQGYQNLGDLNKAEAEGATSEQAFTNQFGAQYDPTARKAAIDERRMYLQNAARNEAIPAALAIADENQDIGAGLGELENKYRSMGMAEPQIQKELNTFRANNSARVEGYEKANKKDADTFLTTVGTPKNPSQIEDIVAQAGQAGLKNTDYLRDRLTSELSASHEQEKYQRGANDYYRKERERNAINSAMERGTAMLQQGATPQEAFAANKSNLTGAQLPKFLNAMAVNDPNLSAMSNTQKEQYQRIAAKGAQGLTAHQAKLDKVNSDFVSQREKVTRITPAVLDTVDKANTTPGGMVGKISDYMTNTGWEPSDMWSDKITGKGRVEQELNNFKAQIVNEAASATPAEVDAILWNAYQDTNKKSFFGDTGLDVELMRTSLTKNIDDFKKGELIDQQRIQFKQAADAEMQELTEGQLDYMYGLKSSIETGNKTGKKGSIVDRLKDIDKNALPIDESKTLVGRYKAQMKQIDKAAKDKQAADTAAAKLKIEAAKKEKASKTKTSNTTKANLLKERIARETQSGYTEPDPDQKPFNFTLKKRPQ